MMQAGKAGLERSLELMKYYTSYYRLLNSTGVDNLTKEKLSEIKKRVSENIRETLEEEKKNKILYEKELASLELEKTPLLNEKIAIEKEIKDTSKYIEALKAANDSLLKEKESYSNLPEDAELKNETEKTYSDKIEETQNSIKQLSDSLQNKENRHNELQMLIAELDKKKEEINKKSTITDDFLAKSDSNTEKYDAFLSKLENMENIQNKLSVVPSSNENISNPPHIDDESDLNAQMQLQVPGNTIYQEGYTPLGPEDYYIQTQEEAANNTIGTDEFHDKSEGSLNNEMIWDTEENLINRQELNPIQQ